MAEIDYALAAAFLKAAFATAEQVWLNKTQPPVGAGTAAAIDRIFESKTQAYREALLGTILAKIQVPALDATLPYAGQGGNAYNGRDIDERVVNPFLQANRVPSSNGPYLSVFRRSVEFISATRKGVRDKLGYDKFLEILSEIQSANASGLERILDYLLYKFVELREQSIVVLSKLRRMSLEQLDLLVGGLLTIPSGGRFPVYLVAAALSAIRDTFGLNWEIDCQGINVADKATGAGGDVTIRQDGKLILAAEITEREVDRSRLVSTFNNKISPNNIEDYVFFVRQCEQLPEVLQQARQYFSQGHEVNFLEIKSWIATTLGTLGTSGRRAFGNDLLRRLDRPEVPKVIKVGWNTLIEKMSSII